MKSPMSEHMEELVALVDALTGPRGTLVQNAIKRLCGVEEMVLHPTAHGTFYRAGMRDAGLKILKAARMDVEKIAAIIQKNEEKNTW